MYKKLEIKNYISEIKKLKNKRIGIIYTYRDEQAKGFGHYDIWEISIVSDWAIAIEEIGAIPYILDVRTFGEKSLNNTLPPLNYIINLNAGNESLSTLGLVPSICGFLNIPCIPANTEQIITGEHKHYSNLIAKSLGLNIPIYFNDNIKKKVFINKPIGLGSSFGINITKNNLSKLENSESITQEFIPGFDLTTFIMYNPVKKKLVHSNSILYIPEPLDKNWFYKNELKFSRKGFYPKSILLTKKLRNKLLDYVNSYGITTYCRIDSRIYCENEDKMKEVMSKPINHDNFKFLEINPMPTIFNKSIIFTNLSEHKLFKIYKATIKQASFTGYLLTNSIIAINNRYYNHE